MRHGSRHSVAGKAMRIGTRKSVMALAQTDEIARQLTAADPSLAVEIVKFKTMGAQAQTGKLLDLGGNGGAFVARGGGGGGGGRGGAAGRAGGGGPGGGGAPGRGGGAGRV